MERRYVRLSDVLALTRSGVDVRVVDYGTEDDRTRRILVKAIASEQRRNPSLSIEVLRRIICDGTEPPGPEHGPLQGPGSAG